MTSKELAYLEDALSKENFIISKINIIKNSMEEKCFDECLNSILESHKKCAKKLEKILEGE